MKEKEKTIYFENGPHPFYLGPWPKPAWPTSTPAPALGRTRPRHAPTSGSMRSPRGARSPSPTYGWRLCGPRRSRTRQGKQQPLLSFPLASFLSRLAHARLANTAAAAAVAPLHLRCRSTSPPQLLHSIPSPLAFLIIYPTSLSHLRLESAR
jgi:hypothetical protein